MNIVVLDRDGVINQDSDSYIKSADEWHAIPGSIDAIATLSKLGFTVAVATNQSGIGRGLFDEYALAAMHQKMHSLVEEAGGEIDGIFYCPHLPDQGCSCRKPGTGLLRQIEREYDCSLKDKYFVGDSMKDVDAARAHGCTPLVVRTGKGSQTVKGLEAKAIISVPVFIDLSAAAQWIINNTDV